MEFSKSVFARFVTIMIMVLGLAACGGDSNSDSAGSISNFSVPIPAPMGAQSIQLSSDVGTAIEKGEEITLSVIYINKLGRKMDVSTESTYTLSEDTVLSQGSDANVFTGDNGGEVTVTATYRGFTSSITIEVAPSRLVDVAIELQGLNQYTRSQIANAYAIGFYSNGNHSDISDQVTWSSSDSSIINFTGNEGEFEAVGAGSVDITATVPSSLAGTSAVKYAVSGGDSTPVVRSTNVINYTVTVDVSGTGITELFVHSNRGPVLMVGSTTQMTSSAVHSNGSSYDFTNTTTWTSSDPSVATVNADGVLTGVSSGFVTITGESNGLTNSYRIRVTSAEINLDSLRIHAEQSTSVSVGHSIKLYAVATLSDGTHYDITADGSWSTGDASKALVNSSHSPLAGRVDGIAAGSVPISVTFDGQSATLDVEVIDDVPVALTITVPDTTLYLHADTQASVTAQYADGRKKDVTSQSTFSVSVQGVIDVSNAVDSAGKVHALSAGSTHLNVAYKGLTHFVTITVVDLAVTDLAITPSSFTLDIGKDVAYIVTATYSDGSTADVSSTATSKVSDTTVASAANGNLHSLAAGTATLTVSFKSSSATAAITVRQATLQSIAITAAVTSIETGDSSQFSATGTYSDGHTSDESAHVAWDVSDGSIGSISATGNFVALASGTTSVSASLDGVSSSNVTVTVTDPAAVSTSTTSGSGTGSGSTSGSGTTSGTPTASTGSITESTLPTVTQFSFNETENKIIPGSDGVSSTGNFGCNGLTSDDNKVGNVALLAIVEQGGCWTDGRYNHNDFTAAAGTLEDASGTSYEAYQLSAPTSLATEFLTGYHMMHINPSTAGTYDIYEFDGNFTKVDSVTANGSDWAQTNVNASTLTGQHTYVVVPTGTTPTSLHSISGDLLGAQVADLPGATVYQYELSIDGNRTPKDLSDFTLGPNSADNRYGQNRYFFVAELSGGNLGIIWQDRDNYKSYLTKFDRRGTSTTIDLPVGSGKNYMLAAATSDKSGSIFYVLIEAGNLDPNYIASSDPNKPLSVVAFKVDEQGAQLATNELNGSSNPLNISSFGDIAGVPEKLDGDYGNTCSLSVNGSELALVFARQQARASDGFNHQGGDAIVLDSGTLALKKNWGQITGHSFTNFIDSTTAGDFIAVDLGDNYPRGIHLHQFDSTSKTSRVVYTVKTAHGYTPTHHNRGPYGTYIIDASGKQTYKWSNDNSTYTEVGAVAEASDGWLVAFSSEHDSNGKVLNNAQTGDGILLADARNLGIVKVAKNFGSSSGSGTEVTDDLVITQGGSAPETGEYYSFDGNLTPQRVTGIKWLTQYTDKDNDNASRVRFSDRADGNFTVIWEKWKATSYVSTHMIIVDSNAGVVHTEETVNGFRLHRRDDLIRIGNRTYSVLGNKTSQVFKITEIAEK